MRTNGTVKFFMRDKGYGFIVLRGGKEDIFFHNKDYKGPVIPNKGLEVTFILKETPKGLTAKKIRLREFAEGSQD